MPEQAGIYLPYRPSRIAFADAPMHPTPVLADDLKADAGAFLVLSRNGEPALVPQFYTESEVISEDDGVVEPVAGGTETKGRGNSLSQRLLDELAMQRRDILAIHLANDPALALDFMVFTLADADGQDWRAKKASTISGSAETGPVTGFEAKDAPASAALAEFAGSLDESWRSGESDVERFEASAIGKDQRGGGFWASGPVQFRPGNQEISHA